MISAVRIRVAFHRLRCFAFALVVALIALPVAGSASPLVATIGQPAPAFIVEDLTGAPLSGKMLRGKPLFINVFATWCPPCRIELPAVVRSHRRFKDRVTFLGVDEQEPAGKIAPFARAMGIHYQIGIDQGQLEASYLAHSIPMSVFIDRHGIVRAMHRGAISAALLERYLDLIAAS